MNRHGYVLLLIVVFCIADVQSLRLQLFDSPNFLGPYATVTEPQEGGCTNLTTNFIQEARSLKTDTCIMVFKGLDCASHSYRLDPGDYSDLTTVQHATVNFANPRSFRLCTSGEGGTPVNVDIYGFASVLGSQDPPYQGLLLKYRDICSCVNLPTKSPYVANVTNIHNFGNCVILYDQVNCTGNKVQLLGGVSPQSLDISTTLIPFIIPSSSIGLCEHRPTCHTLNSTVFKFVINSDEKKVREISTSSDQAMTAKTTFRNNGSAIQTQTYEAKTIIREIVEVTRVTKFSSTNTYSTVRSVTTEGHVGFLFFHTKITETLTEAYTVTNTSEDLYGEKHIKDESREVVVRQELTIPPCSTYEVNSFITMVQHYPVDYDVYMYVGGMAKDRRLEASEVKERLTEGLSYVEDYDNYTVIAKGSGTILADLSMEAVIDGEGGPLEGCLVDLNQTVDAHTV